MRVVRPPHRPALVVLLVAALALGGALVGAGLFVRGGARALSPTPTGPVTMSFSTPTSGLTSGSVVTYSVGSTGGAVLNGAITAHICATGANISNSFNFGYQGTFCVKQAGISSGGLTGGDYATSSSFSGVTTSGDLTFHAGTGTVTWLDDLFGLHTLTCDGDHPCDLVVQVNYNVAPNVSYFTQPLTFAGGSTTTTSPESTTTTSPDSTTTTAAAGATTTTIGAFGASTGSGATPSGTAGASSGTLPFTGADTRDLASAALLLMAAGLILLGQRYRRRTRP